MLLQHDGMDTYGTQILGTATNTSSQQFTSGGYVLPTQVITCNTAYGKNAGSLGAGITTTAADAVGIRKAIRAESNNTGAAWSPTNRLVLGFYVRFPTTLSGSLQFASMGGVSLSIGSDWYIYVDGVQSTYALEQNIWNFVEMVFELSTNKFQLWMTGNMAYEKTVTSPVFDFWEIRSRLISGSGTGVQVHVDDIYLLDGSGTRNNQRLGKCSTFTRYPTADSEIALTPATGSTNFNQVSQPFSDLDSTFVYGNVAGLQDLYTSTTAIPALDAGSIKAITIVPSARMLEPDSLSVTAVIKSGTTSAVGYRMKIKAATYTAEKHIFETDPATSADWTLSSAQALKFGVRLLPKA